MSGEEVAALRSMSYSTTGARSLDMAVKHKHSVRNRRAK